MIGRIPMPGLPGEALDKSVQGLMRNLMDRRLKEQELAQQRQYQQAQLGMRQKALDMLAPLRQAQTEQAKAKAGRDKAQADLPFGGRQMPGPVGRYIALQMVKSKYGEDSPFYQKAKESYDLEQDKMKQTMAYQKSLMESQPKRYATQLGKEALEKSEIDKGYMPGTTSTGKPGVPLTLDQQEKLKGLYSLKQLKDTTDSGIRQRILYSKNMEKTLNNLNVDHLTSYSGIKGAGELIKDKSLALQGKISPRYQKYKEALVAADTLSKQVRQFYGDSITAGIQKGLKELTNPTSWLEHPRVAKARFNAFKKILQTEAKTFTDAAKSAKIYEESPDQSENQNNKNELTYNLETGEFD